MRLAKRMHWAAVKSISDVSYLRIVIELSTTIGSDIVYSGEVKDPVGGSSNDATFSTD